MSKKNKQTADELPEGTNSGFAAAGAADSMGDLPDADEGIDADETADEIKPDTRGEVVNHGFKFKNRLRHEFEAWHVPQEGDILEGIVLARQRDPKPMRKDVPSYLYIVQLLSPATVIFNGSKKKTAAEPGTVVCVRERKALEPLADLLEQASKEKMRLAIQLCVGEKARTRDGQSFWRMDVGYEFTR